MTTGTIPVAATAHTLLALSAKIAAVEPEDSPRAGLPAAHIQQVLNQIVAYVTGISRFIPCNATGTNAIVLTTLRGGAQLGAPGAVGYVDYEVFSAVAAATSTAAVTAQVVIAATRNSAARSLAALKVYKSHGTVQANTGDIVLGGHYTFTYVDSYDSGAGGFELR